MNRFLLLLLAGLMIVSCESEDEVLMPDRNGTQNIDPKLVGAWRTDNLLVNPDRVLIFLDQSGAYIHGNVEGVVTRNGRWIVDQDYIRMLDLWSYKFVDGRLLLSQTNDESGEEILTLTYRRDEQSMLTRDNIVSR